MESLFTFVLSIHISAGSLSLLAFLIPVFTKKGGKTHLLAGKMYTFLMWIVIGTAATLSGLNAWQGEIIGASFLGYLALLTSFPLWYGIVILKYKRDIPDHILLIRKILNVMILSGAVALIIWSIILKLKGASVLLLVFGIIGLGSFKEAFESKAKARADTNWLNEHLSGMIGTGIAAYTAFFAFGGSNFFGGLFAGPFIAIPWIMPTIFGVIFIRQMRKKMRLA